MIFLRLFLILSLTVFAVGCARSKPVSQDALGPKSMLDIYASATGQSQKDVARFVEDNLREQKTFGYVKPYIPVVNQPVVRKVWTPDHKSDDNSDVLIAGHWVYLMIQPATWFIDNKEVNSKVPIIVPVSPQLKLNPNNEGAKTDHGSYNASN